MPDLEFGGFRSELPAQVVYDSWREYRKQGTLLTGGGFLDQPSSWWHDIWLCDAMDAICDDEARKLADRG